MRQMPGHANLSNGHPESESIALGCWLRIFLPQFRGLPSQISGAVGRRRDVDVQGIC